MKALVQIGVVMCMWVSSSGQAEESWSLDLSGPVTVRSREVGGDGVREVWAETELDAPAQDLQAAILDAPSFPRFMPYVTETQVLPAQDGARYVYTRLTPPLVSARDYVLRVDVEKSVTSDGSGAFISHWVAVPDRVPERAGCVRLRRNEGGWRVTPRADGKSHVVYRVTAEMGGGIPSFVVNLGRTRSVVEVLQALEKEARRRASERARAPGSGAPSMRALR